MVFREVIAFFKRHRRKIVFLGLAAAGGYACLRYVLRKLKEVDEEKVSDILAQVRKGYLYGSNERTYSTTVAGMVPALRSALVNELNCEALAAVLKTRPENKTELWNQLKCMAMTRAVVAVYSGCLLATALRVQLSLLGGYTYSEQLRQGLPAGDWASEWTGDAASSAAAGGHSVSGDSVFPELSIGVKQKYLESLHHLLRDGLCNLIQVVTNAVHGHVSSMPLNQTLTYTDIRKLLDAVRAAVEGDSSRLSQRAHRLITFALPAEEEADEGAVALSRDEIALRRIMDETRDIMESADYHVILGASLDKGFSLMLDGVGHIYQRNAAGSAGSKDCYAQAIPLAKIVSQISGLTLTMLTDGPGGFVQKVVQLDCAKRFGHNVYEAFCEARAGQA